MPALVTRHGLGLGYPHGLLRPKRAVRIRFQSAFAAMNTTLQFADLKPDRGFRVRAFFVLVAWVTTLFGAHVSAFVSLPEYQIAAGGLMDDGNQGACNVCGKPSVSRVCFDYEGGSRVEIETCGRHPLAAHFLWLARPSQHGLKPVAPFSELQRVGVVGDRVTKHALVGSLAIVSCESENCPGNVNSLCVNASRVVGFETCDHKSESDSLAAEEGG